MDPPVRHPDPVRPTTVAAFDFDGTLTSGGSMLPFLIDLRGIWPVLRAMSRLWPRFLLAALVGGPAADDVKERFLTRLVGGLPVEVVDDRPGKDAAYLLCARGILESNAGEALLGKLGKSATSRNWATVLKLQALASQRGGD